MTGRQQTKPALLFDLDDTLIEAYANPRPVWLEVAISFSDSLHPLSPSDCAQALTVAGKSFWANPVRSLEGRQDIRAARREIVADAFDLLTARHRLPRPTPELLDHLADRFTQVRNDRIRLRESAHQVLSTLRTRGYKTGLVTNGASVEQWRKIDRFNLGPHFDHIQVEGDIGFGKPDERAYLIALAAMHTTPGGAWMIGDNLEWEVRVPQRLGVRCIWLDSERTGLPSGSKIVPDRTIEGLSELLVMFH